MSEKKAPVNRISTASPVSFNTGLEGSQYARDLKPFENAKDVLGQEQGFLDSSGNFLANMVGSTAVNVAGLGASMYGVGKAIGTGEFKNVWDNELSAGLDKVQKSIDEATPFYNTQQEDKAGLFSTDYLTSAGFWGNTVGKGVSFIAGAYLGGAGLAKVGTAAVKGLSKASSAFSKLVTGEESTAGLINAAKQNNVVGWVENAAKSSSIRNASSFYAQKLSGNMFEAGLEARGVRDEIIAEKNRKYAEEHPLVPIPPKDLVAKWNEEADVYGNLAMGTNMALLQIDGLGLGKTMYGFKNTKKAIQAVENSAGQLMELSARKKIFNRAGKALTGGLEEAAQEGGQFLTEKTLVEEGTQDDKKAKSFAGYVNSTLKGLEQTLGTKEGQESMLAGLLLGGGGAAIGDARSAKTQELMNKEGIAAVNKFLTRPSIAPVLAYASKSFDQGNGQILENATAVNDKKLFNDIKAKDYYNWASTRIEWGRSEQTLDELNKFKNTPSSILGEMFPGSEMTEEKKHQTFDNLIKDFKELQRLHGDVQTNFANHQHKDAILHTSYQIKNIDRRLQELSVKDTSMLDVYKNDDMQNLLAEKEELSRDLAVLLSTRNPVAAKTAENAPEQNSEEVKNTKSVLNNPPIANSPEEIAAKQARKANTVGTRIPGYGVVTNIVNNVATIKDEAGNILHEDLDSLPNTSKGEQIFVPEPSEEDEDYAFEPDFRNPEDNKKHVAFVDPTIDTTAPDYSFKGTEEHAQASDFGIQNLDKMDSGLSSDDKAVIPEIDKIKNQVMDKLGNLDDYQILYEKDEASGRTRIVAKDKKTGTSTKIGYLPNINQQLAGNAAKGSKRSILQFMQDYFTGLRGTDRLKNKNAFVPVILGIKSLLQKAGFDISNYVRWHSKIKQGQTPLTEVMNSPRFLVNNKLALVYFKDGVYRPDSSLPEALQKTIETQLSKPYNKNNLGSQYALMVERPGQPGVYTFIGVKARNLTSDEITAYEARIAENQQGIAKALNDQLFINSQNETVKGEDGQTYPVHYEFDRYEERDATGNVTKSGKLYVKRSIKGTIDNTPIKSLRRTNMSISEALQRSTLRTSKSREGAFTNEVLGSLKVQADKELFNLYFQFDAKKFNAENPPEVSQEDEIQKSHREAEEKKRDNITKVEKALLALNEKNIVLDSSNKFYVNVNDANETFKRISDLKPEYTGPTGGDAADRGTIIDSLLRDFVDNKITDIDELTDAYNAHKLKSVVGEFTPGMLTNLFDLFQEIKGVTKNLKLISTVPSFWGELKGDQYAGTIDLLGIADNGDVFIIDLKTSSRNRRADYESLNSIYREGDSIQQSGYAELLKQRTGIDVKGVLILPLQVRKDPITNQYTEVISNKGAKGKMTMSADLNPALFSNKSEAGKTLDQINKEKDEVKVIFREAASTLSSVVDTAEKKSVLNDDIRNIVDIYETVNEFYVKQYANSPSASAVFKEAYKRFPKELTTMCIAAERLNTLNNLTPAVVSQVASEPPTSTTNTKVDWTNNLSNIKNELSKLKNKEEKLQWLANNNYLDPFIQDGRTSNYLKTATGRVIVKIKIGSITIPFYISTGQGGKTDVEVDKWYVFFGQGKDGWFNKTSGPDMNKQYGVKLFQDIADTLNDVGSKKDEYKVHQDSKGFTDLKWISNVEDQLQTVIDFITPVQPDMGPNGLKATPEQITQLKQNIQTVKDRVALEIAALGSVTAAPIITPPNVIKVGNVEIHTNSDGTFSVLDSEGEVIVEAADTIEEATRKAQEYNDYDNIIDDAIEGADIDPLGNNPKAKLDTAIAELPEENKEAILREVALFENELARILPGIKVQVDFTKGFSYYKNAAITLASKQVSKAKWHEAFHAIFDCFSPEEKSRALRIAAQNFAINPAQMLAYQEFYNNIYERDLKLFQSNQLDKEPQKMTGEDLIKTMYEEKIADLFQDYMDNKPVPKGLFQRFFDAIAKFLNSLLGKVEEPPFAALFEQINNGDFSNRNPNIGDQKERFKIPNSTTREARELVNTLGVQALHALSTDDKLDVDTFLREQIKKYRQMYSAASNDYIKSLRKDAVNGKITKEELFDKVKVLVETKKIIDQYKLYPPLLAESNDQMIIDAVKKFANLKSKIEVELELDEEDFIETVKNVSLAQSNSDELIEAQAVQERISKLSYVENNMLTAVDGKALYDNLKLNLEGKPQKEFKNILDRLSSSKRETQFSKSMQSFTKLFNTDETFRIQCYNAFSNHFVPSYSLNLNVSGKKYEGDKLVTGFTNDIYANNSDNFIDSQVNTWKSQLFGKEFTPISDIEDFITIGLNIQPEVFDTAEGKTALTNLKNFVNDKLNINKSSTDIFKMMFETTETKVTIQNLATENIKYRMDLGELTYKFGGKNFYSMLKENYVFKALKDSSFKWGVFTGIDYKLNNQKPSEQTLYKDMDPSTYLMANLQMFSKDWYIPQQMENKSTVVAVKGQAYSSIDVEGIVNTEISRQTGLIRKYIKELEDGSKLVKGFHIFEDGKFPDSLAAKGYNNTPKSIKKMITDGEPRKMLPRAYQYINIPGANEQGADKPAVYNKKETDSFLDEDTTTIKNSIDELGIPQDLISNTLNISPELLNDRLANFSISQYLNRMQMLAVINPELTKYKNAVDITKRGAGLLLSGPSHFNEGKPANFGTIILKDVEYSIDKRTLNKDDGSITDPEERKKFIKELNATDAQGIETIGRRLDRHLRLGRASLDPNNDFYKQAELLQAYKDDDRTKIAKLNSDKMVLMVDKTGGFDGNTYIKTSIFPLTRAFTSEEVKEGTKGAIQDTYNKKWYLPYPHRILSFQQFNKLQALENKVTAQKRASKEIGANDTIFFEAHFKSAVKLGISNINELDAEEYVHSEFGNQSYRLQQENPSGKSKIKDGTQLIQLIGAFLPDDVEFTGEFRNYNGVDGKQLLLENMEKLLADIRSFDNKMIPNFFKKLELQDGGIYKPFVKYLQDSKETSGGSDNDSEYLSTDENGEFKYSQNMPHLIDNYEQAFISFFNKNLFSQKTPGGKATLVSSVYSNVMRLGDDVITTYEYERLSPEDKANVIASELKSHKPGLGNEYAEVILSEEYLNDIVGITLEEYHELGEFMQSKVKTILGFRIPTQSHHSMMPCKIVDFMPRHYGSVVIAPAEITYLSGADYDVDSLFYQRYGFYKNSKGQLSLVQNDVSSYFNTVMENKIVKDHMELNNPFINETKVKIATIKAQIKASTVQLEKYDVDPSIAPKPEDVQKLKDRLASYEAELPGALLELRAQQKQSATKALNALNFPSTKKELLKLSDSERKLLIKDVSNNALLTTRLNILTSSFDGKFTPAIDRFKEFYEENKEFMQDTEKGSQVYSSFGTFFRHYVNNYAGGKAIGASANGNKIFAHLQSTNTTLSKTIINKLTIVDQEAGFVGPISRSLFTNTNQIYAVDYAITKDPETGKLVFDSIPTSDSKPDNLSSAVSMTVDNVKDQTLVKFNLNDQNMSLLTSAFGIGIGNNIMATLLLNPITKLFTQKFLKDSSSFAEKPSRIPGVITSMTKNYTRDYTVRIDEGNLNNFLQDATNNYENKLNFLKKFLDAPTELEANQILASATLEQKSFIDRQFAILDLYSVLNDISDDSFVINSVVNLNKEVGQTSSDIDYVLSREEKIKKGDNPDGFPPSFFSFNYTIPAGVEANLNSVKTSKNIIDNNLLFYGNSFKNLFKDIDTKALHPPSSKSDFESRVGMKKEFVNFLIIKAFQKYNTSPIDINNVELIEGKLLQDYESLKDYLLKYDLGKMFKKIEPTKQYPYARLGVDSFKKLDPRKKDDIMDSFAGMLVDPKTKEFAINLLSYIATHDNFRFLGNSAVSFMRPSVFNSLNSILKGDNPNFIGLENIIGKDINTAVVGELLSPDKKFNTLFEDYLKFWFSDNRNKKSIAIKCNYSNGSYNINSADVADPPLITYTTTEDNFGNRSRIALIYSHTGPKTHYYTTIKQNRNNSSLKWYQMSQDESVKFFNKANGNSITDKAITYALKLPTSAALNGWLNDVNIQNGVLTPAQRAIIDTRLAELNNKIQPLPIQISKSKVLEGDIFALPGIPVITTNLGGVHGAGLAQAAKAKGLITQGDGSFKATDKVVQLPVKKVWSDNMSMNNNMDLLKESLRSLIQIAKGNPNKTFLLPLAGLGHGEGSIDDILPFLIMTVKASPNIKLVIPAEGVDLGRQGTVRKDYTRENLPKIKQMLTEAGLMIATTINIDEDLPYDKTYAATPEMLEKFFNPFDDTPPGAKFKLNESLYAPVKNATISKTEDMKTQQISQKSELVNEFINKIKTTFTENEGFYNSIGIASVEELDNLTEKETISIIRKFCK